MKTTDCDFCFKPARYVARLGEVSGWNLCKDHLETYEWSLLDLGLIGA